MTPDLEPQRSMSSVDEELERAMARQQRLADELASATHAVLDALRRREAARWAARR